MGWLIVMVCFMAVEALTLTYVSIIFAMGAFVAFILNLCGTSLGLQLSAFIATISILAVLLAKPIAKKFLDKKIEKTNIDALIGEIGVVVTEINPELNTGEAKIKNLIYRARATDGSTIKTGERVIAERIEGVTVYVKTK